MKITTWVVAAILLASATAARADQITFTETAVGSGSLGNTSFSDALITLTGVGDTANATLLEPGVFVLTLATAQVEIAGLGTATFTGLIHMFDNQGFSLAGFSQGAVSGTDILNVADPAFATYDLTTSISVSGSLEFADSGGVNTSAGSFVLNNVANDVTFTATTVPEPSALALAALGAAGCLATRRFTRRPASPAAV